MNFLLVVIYLLSYSHILLINIFFQDDSVLYKNLLQELAQKEAYALPVYNTKQSGESHAPTFVSTVEVGGKVFSGQEAKSKKQAEMSAAKVAYMRLKERMCYI